MKITLGEEAVLTDKQVPQKDTRKYMFREKKNVKYSSLAVQVIKSVMFLMLHLACSRQSRVSKFVLCSVLEICDNVNFAYGTMLKLGRVKHTQFVMLFINTITGL